MQAVVQMIYLFNSISFSDINDAKHFASFLFLTCDKSLQMKKRLLFSLFIISYTFVIGQKNYTQYVDPMIGTGGHGHTYPGAVVPHGMVQLSPDTRLEGWDGCSGYHYSDALYG